MRIPAIPLLAFALLIPLATGAAAANPNATDPLGDYSVSSWNEADGLPAGRIRGIEQDNDGYLWLATDGGLSRFDGVRFDAWAAHVEPHLPPGPITAIASAGDGSLWVGIGGRSPSGRIRGGQLRTYGPREGLEAGYILSLNEDHTGTIWAATSVGLFRFRDDRWEKVDSDQGLGDRYVISVFEDRQHRLWVGTPSAVYRRDREGERFVQVDVIGVSSNVWQSFSEDAFGTVWISDFKEGFRRPGGGTPRAAARSTRRGWGVQLLHDRRGNFWIGTQGQGLWLVPPAPRRSEPLVRMITVDDGLVSNAVQSLLEDREGNIWLGTLGGLQRLSPHRVTPIRTLAIPRAVAATPDGSVWVGTAAGLTRFSAAGRRDYTDADGLRGSLVMALHADPDGTLWISTERGLGRFVNERFSPLLVRPGARIQRVVSIDRSEDGLLLRDFALRVYRWQAPSTALGAGSSTALGAGPSTALGAGFPTLIDDVPDAYRKAAQALAADREGAVWIGNSDGSVGVKPRNEPFRSYELEIGRILCLYEDSDGAMWIGGDDGVTKIAGGRVQTITARQQDVFNGVKFIIEDRDGMMWFGAGNGIVRIEKAEIARLASRPDHRVRYRFFNSADGVAGVPFTEGGGTTTRSQEGRLWFVTSSGVTVVDPAKVGDPRPVPVPRIESMTADSRSLVPGASAGSLLLPPRTSHVQIAFNALTLTDPTRVRFRYRLDGFDREWIEAGTARQASYTNLPPRQYRFRVSATSGDGAWSDSGGVLEFGVLPMFYQTRWFYGVCGFLVFAVVYASWRLHVRQVRRQFALVLAERIRMSRAIHDTLLQGLAALALQVDDLSHHLDAPTPDGKSRVLNIRRQVEEYIRQARKSIWDLRSPILEARDLPHALRQTAELAIAGRPVELDVTVSGTPRGDSAKLDEQLLLIGQEAVNNAIHHGRASRVAVALEYDEDAVRLCVSDDGCGFNPAHVASGHYGLVSMRERAEQVRGRFSIDSTPGSGTRIEAVVPTS